MDVAAFRGDIAEGLEPRPNRHLFRQVTRRRHLNTFSMQAISGRQARGSGVDWVPKQPLAAGCALSSRLYKRKLIHTYTHALVLTAHTVKWGKAAPRQHHQTKDVERDVTEEIKLRIGSSSSSAIQSLPRLRCLQRTVTTFRYFM